MKLSLTIMLAAILYVLPNNAHAQYMFCSGTYDCTTVGQQGGYGAGVYNTVAMTNDNWMQYLNSQQTFGSDNSQFAAIGAISTYGLPEVATDYVNTATGGLQETADRLMPKLLDAMNELVSKGLSNSSAYQQLKAEYNALNGFVYDDVATMESQALSALNAGRGALGLSELATAGAIYETGAISAELLIGGGALTGAAFAGAALGTYIYDNSQWIQYGGLDPIYSFLGSLPGYVGW